MSNYSVSNSSSPVNRQFSITVSGDMPIEQLNALALRVIDRLAGSARSDAVLQLADIRALRTDGGQKIALIHWLITRLEGC